MNNIDTLAKKIFDECAKDGEPVTMEEAREMAEMEAKALNSDHGTETEKKSRKPKVRKIDEVKKKLLLNIEALLQEMGATETTLNNEVELSFTYEAENYSIRLIKHRATKKKGV